MIECPNCGGTGQVEPSKKVKAWGSYHARKELAEKAVAGHRWLRIKNGLVAIVQGPVGQTHRGCIPLLHANGRRTEKWVPGFAAEFTPETPPNE